MHVGWAVCESALLLEFGQSRSKTGLVRFGFFKSSLRCLFAGGLLGSLRVSDPGVCCLVPLCGRVEAFLPEVHVLTQRYRRCLVVQRVLLPTP